MSVQEEIAQLFAELTKAVGDDDDELAHSIEDKLHVLALEAIAAGHPAARELAAAVLKTQKLDFFRWCA